MSIQAIAPVFRCAQHSSLPLRREHLRILSVAAWLSLAQPFTALAQTASPPLPPAAQAALDKGIIAAKVPDYPLAIRYFEDARKLAPLAPVVFVNLGIAESKMPGRELRAMAWFGAYLAAYPDAPNASAVKEQIAVLEVRNQSNVSRLIKTVEAALAQIPGNKYSANNKLRAKAELLADSGDLAGAVSLIKSMDDEIFRSSDQSSFAGRQAAVGDFASAIKTAELITRPDYKSQALLAIGKAQADAKDFAGARRTLAQAGQIAELRKGLSPDYELKRIAEAQAEAGDIAGAQRNVALIKNDSSAKDSEKSYLQFAIGKVQLKNGDIAGAIKTAESIQSESSKSLALLDIAESQARTGDFAAALQTSYRIQDARHKASALEAIVDAQIKAGDFAGARKIADDMRDDVVRLSITRGQLRSGDLAGALKNLDWIQSGQNRDNARSEIVSAQTKAGDIAGAQKTTAEIQSDSYKNMSLIAIVEAEAKAGDIAAAIKTADSVPGASYKAMAQRAIAQAQAAGRNLAGAQRTADLIEHVFYKSSAQSKIAEAQAKAGDRAGALKTFAEAAKNAELAPERNILRFYVAEAQAAVGEIAEAQKTADQITDGYRRCQALAAVAAAQIGGGNLAGAEKTLAQAHQIAAQIKEVSDRLRAQEAIAAAEAKGGFASGAAVYKTIADWLAKLEDDNESYDCPLNTGPFLDLAGYLKSLPPSDDPIKVLEGLRKTAKKIFTAQAEVFELLKQQGIR